MIILKKYAIANCRVKGERGQSMIQTNRECETGKLRNRDAECSFSGPYLCLNLLGIKFRP
jgi:hypothetical protein